jgi:hypothetical protein
MVAAGLAAPATAALHAQGNGEEGALFLLLPIGARSVAVGGAVVASETGNEAVWWNPAAIATYTNPEVAIHHSQTIVATGDALTAIFPLAAAGVLALSANVLDYGEQDVVLDERGPVGKILPRNLVFAGTYALALSPRIRTGITYKLVQLRVDCTGQCATVPTTNATTSAVDVGAQLAVGGPRPVWIGAAVRNVGPRFQVNDGDQADPLPTRVQVGLRYDVPSVDRVARDVELSVSGDVVDAVRRRATAARLGAELSWQERVALRGGYVFDDEEGSGPSLGLGVKAGRLELDVARVLDGLSADAGEPPTYLSLRYVF